MLPSVLYYCSTVLLGFGGDGQTIFTVGLDQQRFNYGENMRHIIDNESHPWLQLSPLTCG